MLLTWKQAGMACLLLFCNFVDAFSQDIVWEKRIALKKKDEIFCMTKDQLGNIYLGGWTWRGGVSIGLNVWPQTFLIKLDENGDTLYVKELDDFGRLHAMIVDHFEVVHIFMIRELPTGFYQLNYYKMTESGFLFDKDTIDMGYVPYPKSIILASDSSICLTGDRWTNNQHGMFYLRIRPDYTYDELKVFQPNGYSTEGNNIEELPNGRIMISGPFSNRLGSVEVNKDGTGDSSWVWGPDSTSTGFQTSAVLNQANAKGFLGLNGPRLYSYDSSRNFGVSIRPSNYAGLLSAHWDGSFVYFTSNVNNNRVWKRNADTSVAWTFNLLTNSSILPGTQKRLTSVLYNEDQSAIFSGTLQSGSDTALRQDPYIVKIAHVGTPVTSLVKPKKGSLANESLAPWPNPTSSTVYLKQHFNKAEVRMYNLAGKEMGVYHLRFAVPIDVSGYESGVYLYRAVIDGKFFSGKIIKR